MEYSIFSQTLQEFSNSLEQVSGEFSDFEEVSIFIPSLWRFSQFPPRVELVNELIHFLLSKDKKIQLLFDGTTMAGWIKDVSSSKIKLVDLNRIRFVRTDGIGEKNVKRMGREENLRIPLLKNLHINSAAMDSSAIIPILTPHASTVFLMNGVISSLLSLTPTETRTRILLEAAVNKHSEALVELFSLLFKKIILSVYDFSNLFNWSGRKEMEQIESNTVLISTDALSGDALVSKLFGWSNLTAKSVRTAIDFGLGDGLHDKTEITGEKPDLPKMKRPVSDKNLLLFPLSVFAKFSVQTNQGCTECLECVYVCPNGSISVDNQEVNVNHRLCIKCFACVDACPEFVLWVKRIP